MSAQVREIDADRVPSVPVWVGVLSILDRALKQNERARRNWELLAQSSSDILVQVDEQGTVVFGSPQFCEGHGNRAVGASIYQLIETPDEHRLRNGIEQVLETGEPCAFELQCPASRGRTVWYWCRIVAGRQQTGEAGAILSLTDFSDLRVKDAELLRLGAIVDQCSEAIISIDEYGRVRTWNRGAELLLGYGRAEMVDRPIDRVLPGGFRFPTAEADQSPFYDKPMDLLLRTKRGRRLDVQLSLTRLCDATGAFCGASIVVHDVSAQLAVEETLREAKDAAQAANRSRNEFFAKVSHELRTPLTGVVGLIDILKSMDLSGEQSGCLETLSASVDALKIVIDDLLDFSRGEAGEIRIERAAYDPVVALDAAVALFRQTAQAAGIELQTQVGAELGVVVGDSHRIQQVLANLLGNAVKFAPQGTVVASVRREPEHPDRLRFAVSDTGIGIEDDALARIFDPFVQASQSTKRHYGGTGLGLSICRQLVRRMGGEISVRSDVGQGSVFEFWIPAPRIRTSDCPPDRRILLAEDNETNRAIVATLLEGLGYHVDPVPDGLAAVNAFANGGYSLVVLDCQMPVMDGFSAARQIRGLAGGDTAVIVAMTAQAGPVVMQRCLAAGMNDCIAKPVTRDVLGACVARAQAPLATADVEPTAIDASILRRLHEQTQTTNPRLVQDIVRAFESEFAEACARLSTWVAERERQRVLDDLHKLRSTIGNVGAVGMGVVCDRLEQSATQEDWRTAQEYLRSLCEAGPIVCAALERIVGRSAQAA